VPESRPRAALEDAGFSVQSSPSGEQAMRLLDKLHERFCVVVTDINLSDRTLGWDVALHARELSPQMPIVYMTGASADEWASQGVPASILIGKPFTSAQITAAVSQLLGSESSNGQTSAPRL
jgi:CheY-like chemotaxis protein